MNWLFTTTDCFDLQLETTLRSERETGILNDNEPFRCMVRFSSSHLLEALKSLAPSGKCSSDGKSLDTTQGIKRQLLFEHLSEG